MPKQPQIQPWKKLLRIVKNLKESIERVESNLDDEGNDEVDGYDTLVQRQEKYQKECEEEG